MAYFLNLAGQKWEHLLVEKRDSNRPGRSNSYWICRCDCGTVKSIRGNYLVKWKPKDCGTNCGLLTGKATRNRVLLRYKWSALLRNLAWSISDSMFDEITKRNCTYCGGIPKTIEIGQNGNFIYNGIDRLDSRFGYTVENSVPCCSVCNTAKSDLPVEDFIQWLDRAYQHTVRKSSKTANA